MVRKVTFVLAALCLTSIVAASEPKPTKQHHVPVIREYLYVVADGLYGYTVKAGGKLKKINTEFPLIGQFPYSMVSSPECHFLYVCGAASRNNNHGGVVYEYSVAPDGKLTPLNAVSAGSLPDVMVLHPSGRFLYCASLDVAKKSKQKNSIFEYHVERDGTLIPLLSLVDINTGPIFSMAFGRLGHFLFLTLRNVVMSFQVGANGTLHLLPAYSFKTNGSAYISTNSSGTYAYVASAGGDLLQFKTLNSGRLVRLTPAVVHAGKNPTSITISPDGRFLYVVCDNGISQYHIKADGTLQPLSHPFLAFGTLRGRLAVPESGQFAYMTSTGGNEIGAIEQFYIKGGRLIPFEHPFVPAGVNPISLVVVRR